MKKLTIILTSCLIVVSMLALPIETRAKTISQFEAEAEKLTKELEEKKSKLVTNEKEIKEIKAKISDIENQITQTENDIVSLEEEINKSNQEIKEKSEESKKILEYYQIANGENAYLEYAFGATSITDMIYRMSVVEQLTEYNDKIMKELEDLIEKNKQQQKDLTEKKESLKKLQEELKSESEKIEDENAKIRVGMPTIEEQIKAAKSNVQYYKSLGCGTNEDIQACQYRIQQSNGSGGGSVPSANGFLRPMEYGYITQRYGNRGHLGIDLGSDNKSITIYPIAAGQLFFAGYDNAGAYIVILRHNIGGRYVYATYAHMRSFSSAVAPYVNSKWGTSASISNGPIISAYTPIGNMGSTGNSSGPHLHLEMSTCSWHKGGGCLSYSAYTSRVFNPANYVTFPSSWNNR
ncbi:MAG: peptidoglycan DD-metalloendopeptidase family protein [Bacilli bacterium]|nr:peptidoglycan DD-metalloendopeptidase family protein [Bacilli bacterium]